MICDIYGKLGTLWMIKNLKQISSDIGCNPFYVSNVSTVSTLSKTKNLGVRGNYAFPHPSLQFLSIFVNVNDMIYGIYGKLGTLLIIKNHTQNFTDISRNPFYVSAVSTASA